MAAPDVKPDPELDKVQLGLVDVDPEVLVGPGAQLREFLNADRDWDFHLPTSTLKELPSSGWRRIHSQAPLRVAGPSETFAAPHPEVDGACVLISVAERDGRWIVSANCEPAHVIPGRASRRRPLRLTWPPGDIEARRVVDIPALTIELHNDSDSVWKPGPYDAGLVWAWLSDGDGTALPASPWFVHGGRGPELEMQPGGSLVLPVTAIAQPHDEPSPGRYQLTAFLTSLNLRSDTTYVQIS